MTEVFALQHLIGSSPEAAVFQAGFCLLLYNLVQTLRSYVAQESRRSPRTISSELLFRDVQGQYDATSLARQVRTFARQADVGMFHLVGHSIGAIVAAWCVGANKLTVNTCTLDHPKALGLYQRAGFVPVRQVTRITDDPRVTDPVALGAATERLLSNAQGGESLIYASDRFGLIHRLNFYKPEELTTIVERSARLLAIPIEPAPAPTPVAPPATNSKGARSGFA